MKLSKLTKFFKFNDDNKTKVIGLLTILIAIWLVLYFIPEVFVSLFNTLLGNLILVVTVLLVYMNDRIYGLIIGLLFILLFRFSQLSKKEGFNVKIDGTFSLSEPYDKQINGNFTKKSISDFLKIQNTINKQKVFDMNTIATLASQEELDYFNKNGMWPWSQKVIDLYQEAVNNNPYIRTVPELATNQARTQYNEASILRILSYQTKEGQFMLNGVVVKDPSNNSQGKENLPSGFGEFGYSSGLISDLRDDVIKCNLKNDLNPTLERITYTGKGGIFGEQTEKVSSVDYHDLEKIIPGFTFLSSPCNPCKAMSKIPDYSCPFRLKVKNKSPFVSDVWQYLWGFNDNPLESYPSFLSDYINPNKFPLLSELQSELQKQTSYKSD